VPDVPAGDGMNNRQKIFVDEYLKCFNASEAARRAGYTGESNRIGTRLLSNVVIKALIDQRIKESHMSADEALKLLAEQARGDIGDLIDDNGLMDIRSARAKGLTKLIKKIKQKTITHIGTGDEGDTETHEIEFEMYDAQSAIDKVLRVAGKYINRTDITSGGEKLQQNEPPEVIAQKIAAIVANIQARDVGE
jgi:phage terminase small subunit